MQTRIGFHQTVLKIRYIDKNKISTRRKKQTQAILGWQSPPPPPLLRVGICHKGDLRMKDFCLPVYFIGFPKGKLSIKWKTICIFSTKGVLCLWALASPWWRLFLERVSMRHVKWSGPKAAQTALCCLGSIVPFVCSSRTQSYSEKVGADRPHMRVFSPFSES